MFKKGLQACMGMAVASVVFAGNSVSAQSIPVDQNILLQLQETIRQQQQQLQQQAEQIKAQSEILQKLQQQVSTMQKPSEPGPAQASAKAPSPADSAQVSLSSPSPAFVKSGNDRVKLSVSGELNRAINVIGDGGRAKLYHVDNDADNTKIRFTGNAIINDDLTIASRLEFAMTADESSQVSQRNQAPGNYIDAKYAEVSLESKTFGKISFGKGDTASYNSATVDLSKTDVVLYSSISDIAGGILFRDKNGALSTTTVANAFNACNGLNTQSRLRYDTPSLLGFVLSGSLVSGQRSDLALTWGGEGYGFQAAAAFGLANPKLEGVSLQYDGSCSVLHTATGLNLTLAGGLMDYKSQKDGTNLYAKLGWLASLTSLGQTAFGVDYTRSRDMAANGDRGYSVGAAVVQAFEKYSTELYMQYRLFSLNRTQSEPVNNINMGTFGVRVKF